MRYIVVLLANEWNSQKFERKDAFAKIGLTNAPADCEGMVPCLFKWGRETVPRENILFIDHPLNPVPQPVDFDELVRQNAIMILEVILDLMGGILVRNPENAQLLMCGPRS